MASIYYNPHAPGELARMILRRIGDKQFYARPPFPSRKPLTAPATLVRLRFSEGVAYARQLFAIPARRAAYEVQPLAPGERLFSRLTKDLFKHPVIRNVETAVYHGHEGDSINVTTRADLPITAVAVRLISAEDVDLESGAAVFADGAWRYATLTEIPLGTKVTVEAKVTDSDGLVVTRRVPIVVA